MNAIQAIRLGIDSSEMISMHYLNDLTDAEMMRRPAPGGNHVKWQVGHLIASENMMIEGVLPNSMPTLHAGFAEKYSKETSKIDDPSAFHTKAELMRIFQAQRAATLMALEKLTPESLDKPTKLDYAPTVGSIFVMQGSHWLMHAGQWAVIRRQLGREPLF